MALAAWPSNMPAPEESSYSPAVTDTRMTTNMSVGIPRVRRQSTQAMGQVQAKYYLSDAEVTTLMDFYDNDVNGGTDYFTVPLKTDGAPDYHEAQFASPPAMTKDTNIRWGVTILFRVRQRK